MSICLEEIEKDQQGILAAVFQENDPVDCRGVSLGILDAVRDYDSTVVRQTLGEFGLRLKDFASVVNTRHPEIEFAAGRALDPDSEVSKTLQQLLQVGQYASAEKLNLVFPVLSRVSGKLPKELRRIDSPYKTQQNIRFMHSREQRDKVRATKQPVSLVFNNKELSQLWNTTPENFHIFSRHSQEFKEEVNKAQKRADRYRGLGCVQNAQVIESDIEKFCDRYGEQHYGFHRISVRVAAIILAKMHNFVIKRREHVYSLECVGSQFDEYLAYGSQHRRYMPSIYPMWRFMKIADTPARIKGVIDYLEAFPDVGGNAVFDHYMVVLPMIEVAVTGEDIVGELISEKKIVPVLLGERDGKCYFISYWF